MSTNGSLNVEAMTMPQLVQMYNQNAPKPVKRFSDIRTARTRVAKLMGNGASAVPAKADGAAAPAAVVEAAAAPSKKPGKGKGRPSGKSAPKPAKPAGKGKPAKPVSGGAKLGRKASFHGVKLTVDKSKIKVQPTSARGKIISYMADRKKTHATVEELNAFFGADVRGHLRKLAEVHALVLE